MPKAPERYLTPAEDALFDEFIRVWANTLGLSDWDFYRGEGRPKNAMADVKPDYKARYAKYRTGNWTHIPPTPVALERVACHEVCHVLLSEMLVAHEEGDDVDWQMSAEHRVVNQLTALFVPQERS